MKFLWQVALTKALKRAAQLFVAWLAAQGLGKVGVTIDQNQLTISLLAGSELLRNFLKVKLGWKWL